MLVAVAVPVQVQEARLVVIKLNLHPLNPSPPPQKKSPSLRSEPSSSREVEEPHLLQNWSFSSLRSTTTHQQAQTSITTPTPSLAKGLVGLLGRSLRREAWCFCVKCAEILHQDFTMASMRVKDARDFSGEAFSRTLTTRCA